MITEYIEAGAYSRSFREWQNLTVLPILEADFSNLPDHLNNIYSLKLNSIMGIGQFSYSC